MARRSHTPYFFNMPFVSVERSESDFLLLPDERPDERRASLGPELRSSFRVNLPSLSLDLTDGGRECAAGYVGCSDGVTAERCSLPSLRDMLTARLGGLVEGGLGPQSLSEAEGESAVEGVVVPVVDPDLASTDGLGSSIGPGPCRDLGL